MSNPLAAVPERRSPAPGHRRSPHRQRRPASRTQSEECGGVLPPPCGGSKPCRWFTSRVLQGGDRRPAACAYAISLVIPDVTVWSDRSGSAGGASHVRCAGRWVTRCGTSVANGCPADGRIAARAALAGSADTASDAELSDQSGGRSSAQRSTAAQATRQRYAAAALLVTRRGHRAPGRPAMRALAVGMGRSDRSCGAVRSSAAGAAIAVCECGPAPSPTSATATSPVLARGRDAVTRAPERGRSPSPQPPGARGRRGPSPSCSAARPRSARTRRSRQRPGLEPIFPYRLV